jgi:hypothetical protein
MRSMPMAGRNHQTASLLKLNFAQVEQRVGPTRRVRRYAADVGGQTTLFKKPLKHGERVVFFEGKQRLAAQQIPAGIIGDRQRVALWVISQQELVLGIGAPELIGTLANHKR